MISRPKILLLIPHLGGGGAERVMALLAQNLSAAKYELHLCVVTQMEARADGLPEWVQLHALGARRVRGGAVGVLRLVRSLQPDLILSGMYHLNFLVLLLRPLFPRKTRVLVRQNGTVSAVLADGGLPWYTRLLYRLLYRRADGVICQTRAMADDLARELRIEKKLLTVLPNPVDGQGIRRVMSEPPSNKKQAWTGRPALQSHAPWVGESRWRTVVTSPGPHLLAVGRLVREKGFDLLLSALVEVRRQFPTADLVIAGSGAEEAALKAQCHALGLDAAVCFAGHVAQPWSYFSAATLFVLSSRQEGMPNAMLEAAAAGLPIVALPACGGVVELLSGKQPSLGLPGVWLAPEVSAQALADCLLAALHTLQPCERFAHGFIEEFQIESSMRRYESLIDQTLSKRP